MIAVQWLAIDCKIVNIPSFIGINNIIDCVKEEPYLHIGIAGIWCEVHITGLPRKHGITRHLSDIGKDSVHSYLDPSLIPFRA